MKATSKKLTGKQELFVKHYVSNGLNATQAMIDAGYSEKTARMQGSQNLTKVNIQEAIQKAQKKTSEKLEITRESLLNDIQVAKDMALTEEQPQFQAYLKAIELQAKMLGLNEPDKIDIQGQLRVTSSRGSFADR
jgi:phage terminase small subunit